MNKNNHIFTKTRSIVQSDKMIIFAYMHGSALNVPVRKDIDIAIFLDFRYFEKITNDGSADFDIAIPLELNIETELKKKVDVQILNNAPLPFRFEVVSKNVILIDRQPELREKFELLSRVEYFDFRPRLDEYLAEAAK